MLRSPSRASRRGVDSDALLIDIAAGLDLSATALGSLYLGATLGAATLLPVFGPWIDRIDLKFYVALVAAGLALACGIASIAQGAASLFVAFLLLRLTGQGLMPHTGITSVARHFAEERGRALSITSTGFSIAEGAMPFVAALMIVHLGWRASYMVVGLLLLVCAAPALYGLAARMPEFSRPPGSDRASPRPRARDALRVLSRSRFFQGVLPIICFMPFAGTAFIFHIQTLAGMRGWSSELVAAAFGAYAVSHATALLASGIAIDRFGARRLLPGMIAPMLAGLAILAGFAGPAALILFLALMGVASGLVQTTTSAAWAEVYGVTRLGAIRSLIVMVTVAASALGPAALGAALDAGASLPTISLGTLAIGGLFSIVAIWGARTASDSKAHQVPRLDDGRAARARVALTRERGRSCRPRLLTCTRISSRSRPAAQPASQRARSSGFGRSPAWTTLPSITMPGVDAMP